MAWDIFNRAYTIGTIDVAQDITPGVAQTGFRDFSGMASSDTTFIVATQGAKWAYMKVSKVGAILRPGTYKDGSNGEGASVTFDAGTITVFSDLGWQDIVYNDGDGNAQNAEGVLRSFSPETLAALKTTPLPASGKTVAFMRGILADDQKGAFYVWDPDEATAGDDFTYVVSSLSATGRWVRQSNIFGVPDLANDAAAYSGSVYGVSDDLRHKSSTDVVKKIPRVENFVQGSYATLAALKAVTINDPNGNPFSDNDLIILRGITAEGDIPAPLYGIWDKDSTNTDSLDVTFVRPTSIAGANPGRYQFTSDINTFNLRGQRIKTHFLVIDRGLLDPPGAPDEGDHYLLPASGTLLNGWSAFTNNSIVAYFGGAWREITPLEGDTVDILDEDVELRHNGSAWADPIARTLASVVISNAVVSIPATGVGGTGDAIALTVTGGPALADGLTLSFVPGAANTGATTVNYNAGGALALVDGEDASLDADALSTTAPILIRYTATGTKWRLVSGGGSGAVVTEYRAQAINAAATFDLFDAGVAGKYWEVIARHATDPDISAQSVCLGDTSDPVLQPPDETIGSLEFSFSGTTLRLGNTSGSNGTYNILIKEMF